MVKGKWGCGMPGAVELSNFLRAFCPLGMDHTLALGLVLHCLLVISDGD
jgi:hypothetical protein